MAYKILTKNGIDNSNIDGARGEYFNSGMRDGIVQGVLNEGTFIASSSNVISLDTCELRIAGHRIVIDEPVYHTFSNAPSTDTRYAYVAQIFVGNDQSVEFSLFVQTASTSLIKNDLYKNITGAGTYQVEIGRFTLLTTLAIEDVVRTLDVITGGTGKGSGAGINIGNVTTQTLDPDVDAEVDVSERYEEDEGKEYLDFQFGIPKGDKGDKGDQGVAYPTAVQVAYKNDNPNTSLPVTVDVFFNNNQLKVDDYITFYWYNSSTTDSYLVAGQVKDVKSVTEYENGMCLIRFEILLNSVYSLKGNTGDKGDAGTPNTLTIGTVTTGSAGSQASATITGESPNQILNLTIPQGLKGDTGAAGQNGTNGSDGLNALSFNGILYSTSSPNTSNVSNFVTATENFNRTPIVNEYVNIYWNNTNTGITYLVPVQITNAGSIQTQGQYNGNNVIKITGEKGDTGTVNIDLIYPIGSIYMSVNSTNPSTLFGGTWEQLENRFLLGAGSLYTAGATGGEATHTLSIAEMPRHTHTQNAHTHTQNAHSHTQNTHSHNVWSNNTWGDASIGMGQGSNGSGVSSVKNGNSGSKGWYFNDYQRQQIIQNSQPTIYNTTATNNSTTASNQNTGGGASHNNMPPYLAVYMWKRVS